MCPTSLHSGVKSDKLHSNNHCRSKELDKPAYRNALDKILCAIYTFPSNITETVCASMPYITTDLVHRLAWFYARVAAVSDAAREDELLPVLCEQLQEHGGQCSRHLRTILVGAGVLESDTMNAHASMHPVPASCQTAALPLTVPGGRHNNDFLDYRTIKVLPTKEQMLCDEQPHLPHAPTSPTDESELLDRLFRLYHEDMLGPMRESLLQIKRGDKKELQFTFDGAHATSVAHRTVQYGKYSILLPLPRRTALASRRRPYGVI